MSLSSIDSSLSLSGLKRRAPSDPLRLLVSVRDAEEARIAVAAGVDVIDVKEPSRGALGRADDGVLHRITEAVRGRAVLSFAAGESIDSADDSEVESDFAQEALVGYSLFKYGPAGLALREDWRKVLTKAWRSTKGAASPIAVAYVDYEAADAPPPEAIVELAIEHGCVGMLFDTYGKAPRLGLTALSKARLRGCVERANDAGLLVSLAGSLGANDIAEVRQFNADLIAVRGAACIGDRAGHIDAARIDALKEAISRDAACSVEFDAGAIDACPRGRESKSDRA
jgi:uncharacterized protein (UPF0264 family)